MDIKVDDTIVRTDGLGEYAHLEIMADAGDERFVERTCDVVERLAEVVAKTGKQFTSGERISFEAALVELREVDGYLQLWEPNGDDWRPGIKHGIQLLQDMEELAEEYDIEEGNVELNAVCSMSPNVGKTSHLVMRHREEFSNHSGWEIVAQEDAGNPAGLSHPTLASLWKRDPRLLVYLGLPVGYEITIDGASVNIDVPSEPPKPVWEEPDEVFAHHDPAWAARADWMVAGILQEPQEGQPSWEWIPVERTGSHRARICAVPFLLTGLALGDEVSINENGVITGKLHSSGRIALRIEFSEVENPFVERLLAESVLCEWMNESILAIDCPNENYALELIEEIEDLDEAFLLSHSLPYRPRRLNRFIMENSLRDCLQTGTFLGMLTGLFVDGSLSERLWITLLTIFIDTFALWGVNLSRWWVPKHESAKPHRYIWRVRASCTVLYMLMFVNLLLAVSDYSLPVTLGISFVASAILAVLVGKRRTESILPVLPTTQIPPSFYTYARATLGTGKVEIIVGEGEQVQAIIADIDKLSTRSYRSFFHALFSLEQEHTVGDWFYAR